jgi:hypothetical protein
MSWEEVTVVLGVVTIVSETFIRIRNANKKSASDKETEKETPSLNAKSAEDVFKEKLEMEKRIISIESKIENFIKEIEALKVFVSQIEEDSLDSIAKISQKMDNLQNILIEMNLKKR